MPKEKRRNPDSGEGAALRSTADRGRRQNTRGATRRAHADAHDARYPGAVESDGDTPAERFRSPPHRGAEDRESDTPVAPYRPHPSSEDDGDSVSGGGDTASDIHFEHRADDEGAGEDEALASNASTSSNASRMSNAGSTVLRLCGHKVKIPFIVWTFLAMLVPVIFLVASTAMGLAAAEKERSRLAFLAPLVRRTGDCMFELVEERSLSTPWVALGLQPTLADTGNRSLAQSRERVTQQCVHGLLKEVKRVADRFDAFQHEVSHELEFVRALGLWRERVDQRLVPDHDVVDFYTAAIAGRSDLLVHVANELTDANRPLIGQVHLFDLINWYGVLHGLGGVLAMAPTTTNASTIDEMQDEYRVAFFVKQHSRRTLLHVAEDSLANEVDAWVATAEAREMLRLTDLPLLADGSYGPLVVSDVGVWWTALWAAMTTLKALQATQLETVLKGSVDTLVFNAIFMTVGVAVCIVAAALLAFQQIRVRDGLLKQVATIERTKTAVSAFVPRFTLNKMGYTSITQVRVGESTNVALSMLYSEIRGFTTVSEGMSNDALFEWVQSYFERVTRIVESHRGNINEFIGDSIFCVFSTCYDGLECAVDMQADVQELNVERLCSKEDSLPLEIGIGLHHDVVALGILGDSTRHTCTTISASVNVASGLESLTAHFGCKILASRTVVEQLSVAEAETMRFRRLGKAVVKGSIAAVPLVEVFQSDDRPLQMHKLATRAATERVIDAALAAKLPGDFMDHILAAAAEFKHDPSVKLGSGYLSAQTSRTVTPRASPKPSEDTPSPSVAAPFSGKYAAEMGEIVESLRELEVRDLPLEAVLRFGMGAGAITFEAK